MNTLKGTVWPIVAGFLVVVILSTSTDAVMEKLGIFPPISSQGLFVTWMLAVALAYRTVYTVLGGYVTAWLSSQNQMRNVWILAALGQVGGIVGVVAGWELSAHWYPIAIAVLAIPSVWLGGYLKMRRSLTTISTV